jgi:hypothetical protein
MDQQTTTGVHPTAAPAAALLEAEASSSVARTAARRHARTWSILLVALLAAGVLWRIVRYALGFPIWGDEAFVAVDFVKRGYAEMIEPLTYGQIVPLVFMWAELAISRMLGLSEWALRLLPFAAGLASLPLFWRFAQSVLPRRPALLAIGIFAASVYLVRHAAEVKPYATDMLLALGLLMLAWRVCENRGGAGSWAALIVGGAAAVWCSYPVIFVLAAIGTLLAWRLVAADRRGRASRDEPCSGGPTRRTLLLQTLCYAIAVGGSFVLMYFLYGRPHAQAASGLTEINMWERAFPPLALSQIWKLPLWLVLIHTDYMLAYPLGGRAPASAFSLLLVVIGAVRLWGTRRDLLWLLLGPLVFTMLAAAAQKYPYGGSARTSLYMAPAFCLLAGLGLSRVLNYLAALARIMFRWPHGRTCRVYLTCAAVVLLLIAVGGTIGDAVRPYKEGPVQRSRAAVDYVVEQTRPGDRWVVFNATERVDYAPWLGDWRGTGAQFVFDVLRFHPVPLSWAPLPDTVTPDPGGRVWFFAYRGWKVPFPEEQLEGYLGVLTRRLGQPQMQRFFLKEKEGRIEAIDLYLFEPQG